MERPDLLSGRYRLVERIGTGGMSVVWRGYDELLGRRVAVKVLDPQQSGGGFRGRLRQEAQAAACLVHPHIATIYDYGEETRADGTTMSYVVMELVNGHSLATRLADGGALPWREAVAICADLAEALAAAHRRGVVHRDVTPGNVMLHTTGAIMVDFGISAPVGGSDAEPDGKLLGTPAYVAPERLTGAPVGPAADVYALGVLLYRAISGRLPWAASSAEDLIKAHLHAAPAPLPLLPGLPGEVVELYRACLAKSPEDRPSSREVARVLGRALGSASLLDYDLGDTAQFGISGGFGEAGEAPPISVDVPSDTAALTWHTEDMDPGQVSPAPNRIQSWSGSEPLQPANRSEDVGVHKRALRFPVGWFSLGLLIASALLVAGAMVWEGDTKLKPPSSMPGPDATERAEPTESAGATPVSCRVRYTVGRTLGRGFTVAVTVTNTGAGHIDGWQLGFTLPGDQRIAAGTRLRWQQDGRQVVGRAAGEYAHLAAGQSVRFGFVATGQERPSQLRFTLNNSGCTSVAAGPAVATGQPSEAHQDGGSGGSAAGAGPGKAKRDGRGGHDPGRHRRCGGESRCDQGHPDSGDDNSAHAGRDPQNGGEA